MTDVAATARTFLDFDGLGRLRARARAEDADSGALREAARQFEAQLLSITLQSMRKAVVRDEQSTSGTVEMYQEMMDREVALLMAQRGGIGLADSMVRQMGGAARSAPPLHDAAEGEGSVSLQPAPPPPRPLSDQHEAASWRMLRERAAIGVTPPATNSTGEPR